MAADPITAALTHQDRTQRDLARDVMSHPAAVLPFAGIEPTGREFRCRMTAFFVFGAGRDGIECERVYFDSATILRQLVS